MFEIIAKAEGQRAVLQLLNNANDRQVVVARILVSDGKDNAGTEKQVLSSPIVLKAGENKVLDMTSTVLEVLKPTNGLEERVARVRTEIDPDAFSKMYLFTTVIYRTKKILWFGID